MAVNTKVSANADVAVKQNNRNEAIAYYSKAAEAGGDVAEEAKRKLAALTQ